MSKPEVRGLYEICQRSQLKWRTIWLLLHSEPLVRISFPNLGHVKIYASQYSTVCRPVSRRKTTKSEFSPYITFLFSLSFKSRAKPWESCEFSFVYFPTSPFSHISTRQLNRVSFIFFFSNGKLAGKVEKSSIRLFVKKKNPYPKLIKISAWILTQSLQIIIPLFPFHENNLFKYFLYSIMKEGKKKTGRIKVIQLL